MGEFDFLQLGLAGGALLTLIIISRMFKGVIDAQMKHSDETTDRVLAFFGNHMSHNVEQAARTATALEKVAGAIDDMASEARSAHDQAAAARITAAEDRIAHEALVSSRAVQQ